MEHFRHGLSDGKYINNAGGTYLFSKTKVLEPMNP